MPQPRLHHIVPKLYQKGFALKTGKRSWQVAVTDRATGTSETRNIDKVLTRPYWNSIVDADGHRDSSVEILLADMIDGPAAPGIQALRHGVLPQGEDRGPIALFMAAQLSRGVAVRENLRSSLAEVMRMSLKLRAANSSDEHWLADIGEVPSEAVKARLIDSRDHLDIRPTEAALLPALFSSIDELAHVLLKRSWTLIELARPGFFTGEHPVVHVNSRPGPLNFGVITAEKLHFPVSPVRALVLSHPWDRWHEAVAKGSDATAMRLNWATFTHPSNQRLLSHPDVRSHPLPGPGVIGNEEFWI